jgi:hypothetical protein
MKTANQKKNEARRARLKAFDKAVDAECKARRAEGYNSQTGKKKK